MRFEILNSAVWRLFLECCVEQSDRRFRSAYYLHHQDNEWRQNTSETSVNSYQTTRCDIPACNWCNENSSVTSLYVFGSPTIRPAWLAFLAYRSGHSVLLAGASNNAWNPAVFLPRPQPPLAAPFNGTQYQDTKFIHDVFVHLAKQDWFNNVSSCTDLFIY